MFALPREALTRACAVVCLLALLGAMVPAAAFAQATKAGVVTALEGSLAVLRTPQREPARLALKDDVFVNDRLSTGDRSLARVLLGGKAVVALRERSTVTLPERPGHATVTLGSGKAAVAVAHEKMKPGELVEIRTPNAVCGIRGTVVIAEVLPALVQGGGIRTTFYVVRGTIEARVTDASATSVSQVTVSADHFVTMGGGTTPTVTPMSAEQKAAALAGLQPSV